MIKRAIVGMLLFAAIPASAWGCSFSTDCAVGSQCVKARNQINGICVGGLSPGNKNDQRPVYSPLDPNRTVGNTCSFDTDCGPGNACLKQRGYINGTCVRR